MKKPATLSKGITTKTARQARPVKRSSSRTLSPPPRQRSKGNHNAADLTAVLGRTGTGKSTSVQRSLHGEPRVIVADVKHEYAAAGWEAGTLAELLARLERNPTGKLRFAVPLVFDDKKRAQQFGLLCSMAWLFAPVCLVVEELWSVTRPGWAPGPWRRLVLAGRARGVRVVATSQRPAGMDKDFLSQCTTVRSFALPYGPDADVVGRRLGVEPGELSALPELHFLERVGSGGLVRGRL